MKKEHVILIIILLISLLIRLPNLGEYDVGSYWDEGNIFSATKNVMQDTNSFLFPTLYEKEGKTVIYTAHPLIIWTNLAVTEIFGFSNFNVRISTTILSVLTIIIMFLIVITLYSNKQLALIASFIIATFPINVAFSRVTSPHTIELFFFMLIVLFTIKYWKEKKEKYLFGVLGALTLEILAHGWMGLPMLGMLFLWVVIFSKEKFKITLKAIIILLIAATPLILFAVHMNNIYQHHKELYNPFSEYDDLRKTFLFEMGGDYVGVEGFNFIERIKPRYLPISNLTKEYLFTKWNFIYSILIISGLLLLIRSLIKNKKYKKENLLWIFLLIGFIPIHTAQKSYLQHLIILTPIITFFAANAVYKILTILNKKNLITKRIIMSLLVIFFLFSPINMIIQGDEISYQKNYYRMANYVIPRSEGYEYNAIIRYYPAFAYYTGKGGISTDTITNRRNEQIKDYIENNRTRFVEVKNIWKDNTIHPKDYYWVKENCNNVNLAIGLKEDAIHALYDCKEYQDKLFLEKIKQ